MHLTVQCSAIVTGQRPCPRDLIGSAEAALIIGIDKPTLTRWVAAGRITPVHKLPGKNGAFIFHRADVTALAKERAS
jgi:predicted site-specific integrase-resolvase